jgi:hypothetical protein
VENPHAGERRESTTACRAKQHSPGAKRTGGSGMRSLLLLAQSGTGGRGCGGSVAGEIRRGRKHPGQPRDRVALTYPGGRHFASITNTCVTLRTHRTRRVCGGGCPSTSSVLIACSSSAATFGA